MNFSKTLESVCLRWKRTVRWRRCRLVTHTLNYKILQPILPSNGLSFNGMPQDRNDSPNVAIGDFNGEWHRSGNQTDSDELCPSLDPRSQFREPFVYLRNCDIAIRKTGELFKISNLIWSIGGQMTFPCFLTSVWHLTMTDWISLIAIVRRGTIAHVHLAVKMDVLHQERSMNIRSF